MFRSPDRSALHRHAILRSRWQKRTGGGVFRFGQCTYLGHFAFGGPILSFARWRRRRKGVHGHDDVYRRFVAAAAIAPLGEKSRSLRARAFLTSASRYGPSYCMRLAHVRHSSSEPLILALISSSEGATSGSPSPATMARSSVSPALIVRFAVAPSSPRCSMLTPELRRNSPSTSPTWKTSCPATFCI